MLLTEDTGRGQYQIKAYDTEKITVNESIYTQSLILSAESLIENWPVRSVLELTEQDLQPIIELKPAIVLLGTGKHFIMPAAKQLLVFHQNKIGIECMDTGAACRTYMALMAEERNVVAALLID